MKTVTCWILLTAPVFGQAPAILSSVGIDQRMNAQVPPDLMLTDENGKDVKFGDYLGKPVILALVYYQCPSLCNMVLNGVVRATRGLPMTAGEGFNVVAVSFDPRETPEMAAEKRRTYLKEYDRPSGDRGWHFLTGPAGSTRTLADTVGFRYSYDALTNQFAHASAIMILTPEGRVARYFYGIDYPARDVRLGIEEASEGRISSRVDQVILYCFHYDPAQGKYGLVIMNVLRLAGAITLVCLVAFMVIMFRRDLHRRAHAGGA